MPIRPIRFTRAAVALALLAAIAAPSALRAADAPLIPVTVGALPVDTSAVIFYAQELGYFQKAGLDVKIQILGSGPVIAQAVVANALDIGVANVATVAVARSKGVALKFIAPAAIAGPTTMTDIIMVAKDSPLTKAADLNGKTIGVNGLRDLQQICAMAWMDKHGGDSKTVKFVEVPFPQMAAAVEAKRVDAALLVEPFVSVAKAAGNGHVLGSVLDGVGSRYMIVGWLATDTWLQAHPDVATKFATAIRQAAVWANAHESESAAILTKNSKLDPAVAATMARANYGLDLTPSLLQPVIDGAVKYGILEKPLPVADLIWKAK